MNFHFSPVDRPCPSPIGRGTARSARVRVRMTKCFGGQIRCERPPALAAEPPLAPSPHEGDTKSGKINESYSPPCEGESRRRRQGVAHTKLLSWKWQFQDYPD